MKVTKRELENACYKAIIEGCEDTESVAWNGATLLEDMIKEKISFSSQSLIDTVMLNLKKDIELDFD